MPSAPDPAANPALKPPPDWAPDGGADASEVRMPAEALLRLSAGRLDRDHTPADVLADRADLDRLRKMFPGY